MWCKRASGVFNGIDTKQWLESVHTHMRHMENAIRRGDAEQAEAQAACVRGQLSMLMRSIGRSGFSGDVKMVERISGHPLDGDNDHNLVTIRWISDHESWERSKQFAEKRRAEDSQ